MKCGITRSVLLEMDYGKVRGRLCHAMSIPGRDETAISRSTGFASLTPVNQSARRQGTRYYQTESGNSDPAAQLLSCRTDTEVLARMVGSAKVKEAALSK